MSPKTLSIVVPAYNEERYIATLLSKVLSADLGSREIDREIVVIDDCSTDRTPEIVAEFKEVTLYRRPRNGGKGEAVRAGLRMARGDFIVIQDADLEYDPADYAAMLRALMDEGLDAVYGSRYLLPRTGVGPAWLRAKHAQQSWAAYAGGRSLSLFAWLFLGRYISDTVTALKLFRSEVVRSLTLETSGFELDHEITAKLLARGCRIGEVPIRYYPRNRAAGKKIGLKDWFRGVRTFFRYRKG